MQNIADLKTIEDHLIVRALARSLFLAREAF
jgi:hypothetical protein